MIERTNARKSYFNCNLEFFRYHIRDKVVLVITEQLSAHTKIHLHTISEKNIKNHKGNENISKNIIFCAFFLRSSLRKLGKLKIYFFFLENIFKNSRLETF